MPYVAPPKRKSWQPKRKAQGGRKADDSIYRTSRWKKLSKAYRLEHPLCEKCESEGKINPSQVADHIVRIEDGGDPFDWDNLQALCHRCHNSKSGKERHGYKEKPKCK